MKRGKRIAAGLPPVRPRPAGEVARFPAYTRPAAGFARRKDGPEEFSRALEREVRRFARAAGELEES
jgi:hypothetical protein